MSLRPLNPLSVVTSLDETEIAVEALDLADMRALIARWHAIRAAGHRPSYDDFRPETMWNLVGNIILIDIEPGPSPVFRYRLHGTRNTHVLGMDLTGKTFQDVSSPVLAQALQRTYQAAMVAGVPLAHRVRIADREHARIYDRIILPLFERNAALSGFLVVSADPQIVKD